ncbi:hypothetical protein NUACC26_011200 [Scytonema sp. NUACC26]
MLEILALLQCLQPHVKSKTVRQLNQIVQAMLAMTGLLTMLGISRWTVQGERKISTVLCSIRLQVAQCAGVLLQGVGSVSVHLDTVFICPSLLSLAAHG